MREVQVPESHGHMYCFIEGQAGFAAIVQASDKDEWFPG